ncbi:ATP-binding protein [soil metagenome]
MMTSYLDELRLTAYKSFRDAVLPMGELTLVVGRNGSGKSNALDGLWTLVRLAHGEDIRDALDGGRDGPAVRGGAAGGAPFGTSTFTLGCTARTGEDVVTLDVSIQIEPDVQVIWERLALNGRLLLSSDPPTLDSSDISAYWDDGRAGLEPADAPRLTFRATRLLCTQVLSRVPATTAGRRVHAAAAQVVAALRSVFVLDPVPHMMRQYVPARDVLLRRDADNLSAAVGDLFGDPANVEYLRAAMTRLNEQDVLDVTISTSELDDVMLTLLERSAAGEHQVSARVMSDGSLRFLAILVALMQAPTVDTTPEVLADDDAVGQTLLVIEELENGLHASQATTLVGLIREQVASRRVRTLATAHSPAVLDALTGDEHHNVVVCQRQPDGISTLHRLVDLPNYWRIATMGGLGNAAKADRLRYEDDAPVSARVAALQEILDAS